MRVEERESDSDLNRSERARKREGRGETGVQRDRGGRWREEKGEGQRRKQAGAPRNAVRSRTRVPPPFLSMHARGHTRMFESSPRNSARAWSDAVMYKYSSCPPY